MVKSKVGEKKVQKVELQNKIYLCEKELYVRECDVKKKS